MIQKCTLFIHIVSEWTLFIAKLDAEHALIVAHAVVLDASDNGGIFFDLKNISKGIVETHFD
jgi:hypothetical protein